MVGVCVATDPAQCPSPEEIQQLGADGIRIVATPDSIEALSEYLARFSAETTTAIVLTSESLSGTDVAAVTHEYALNLHPTYWIIGNEIDGEANTPSDPKSPEEYHKFWQECTSGIRSVDPDARCVVGGLVSGQPSRLKDYWQKDAFAYDVHPAAKVPKQAEALLRLYQKELPGAKQMVLEWYAVPEADPLDWLRVFKRVGVVWATFFAWHCKQNPGMPQFDVPGLFDAGEFTDYYKLFQHAIAARIQDVDSATDEDQEVQPEAQVTIEERDQAADFSLGERWAEEGQAWRVRELGDGVRMAGYEKGIAVQIGDAVWELPHVGPGGFK